MEAAIDRITVILIVLMVISFIWLINSTILLIRLIKQQNQYQKIYNHMKDKNDKDLVEYSTKTLEFIKNITNQVAVLKFRTFIDSHDITKITKANIEKLVGDVADTVYKSINSTNIIFDDTLYTKNFYEKYIIEMALISIKNLLDRTIDGEI